MLDKEKVKLMTALADYEQNEGKEDLKITEYYRKDYAEFHTICSVIWVTLGYAGIVGLGVLASLDFLLLNLSKSLIITMILGIAGGYVAVLIIYILLAQYIFRQKHKEAKDRLASYNYNLTELLKMYEKEKR